jgi:hypothetical protein
MTVIGNHRTVPFVAVLLGAGIPAPTQAEEPMAVPYRPTVSTQANLPTPGWLEVEMGIGRSSGGDDKRRDNFNYLLKYAFDEDWAVMAGGEGHVRRRSVDDESFSGLGDTSFTLKRRFGYSEQTLFGLEGGFKSPTANNNIGSGKTDYTLNGILSSDRGPIHLDANLRATRLGAREQGTGRYETTWAAAFSINQENGSYVAAEVSGVNRRDTAPKTQFMAAVGYAPDKRTVFDFGASWGLSKSAPDWGVVAGVTYLWEKISK